MIIELEFVTDDQAIIDICRSYWEVNAEGQFIYRVNDVAQLAGIPPRGITKFIAEHCRVHTSDIKCSDCGKAYSLTSRSDYHQRRSWGTQWQCDECRRLEADREHAARLAATEAKRLHIHEHYSSIERVPIDSHEGLSLKKAVALLALLRLGTDEKLNFINPIADTDGLYAPTTEMAADLLRLLYHSKCIYVHPSSSHAAFADDITTFYLFNVAWLPPIDSEGNTRGLLDEIDSVFRKGTWPKEWFEESVSLWRELALHESIQYLHACMEEHSFEFNPGDKTKQVLSGVLESYSVAQTFVFIWRAVKDAAAYYMSDHVSKKQAANSAIGRIQRQAERALAENWEIKPYRRDRRAPESMISHVLYRTVLKLGDSGINYVPNPIVHDHSEYNDKSDTESLNQKKV